MPQRRRALATMKPWGVKSDSFFSKTFFARPPLHPKLRGDTVGRFVFVPDSLVDEHDGCYGVEAAGPPSVSRTVQFAKGESDEGLDVARPIVVEGELHVIQH